MKIKYRPYKGFYDLRKYKLNKQEFRKLWNIQDFLEEMNKHPDYYKKHLPAQWQKGQEISARMALILQEKKLK